MISWSKRCSL